LSIDTSNPDAIEAGRDGATIDPTDSAMMNTIYASRALLGHDN